MTPYSFKADQWVPYPVELVFAFFANPENLPRLMPAMQKARIEKPSYVAPPAAPPGSLVLSPAAGAGSQFIVTRQPISFVPLRMPWVARIVDFEWNDHFCDEQISGPFGYWRHCHRVSPEQRGKKPGTLVADEIVYGLKFGLLSAPANALVVKRQLKSVFEYRRANLEDRLQQFALCVGKGTS